MGGGDGARYTLMMPRKHARNDATHLGAKGTGEVSVLRVPCAEGICEVAVALLGIRIEAVVIELPKADIEGYGPAADGPPNENQDKLSELKMSRKSLTNTKRRPACLDLLKMKNSVDLDVVFPAKTQAQPIRDISLIEYPDGVQRPKDDLNVNGMPGILFRFVRHHLVH